MIVFICTLNSGNDQQAEIARTEKPRLIVCIDLAHALESVTGINPYTQPESGQRKLAELTFEEIAKLNKGLQEINMALHKIALENGIDMVIQSSSGRMVNHCRGGVSKEAMRIERHWLEKRLSNPVVFHQKLDVTALVIHELKQKDQSSVNQ